MFEYRPDLKGIKTLQGFRQLLRVLFEYRPDLKGIKTETPALFSSLQSFEYRPDLKGIKTWTFLQLPYYASLNTALT